MAERRPQTKVVEMVRELTTRHTHTEHYQIRRNGTWYGRDHVTTVPSLLDQLWENDTPSNSAEEGPRPEFGSRPAARLDALDAAVRIDLEANQWILDLGEKPRSLRTVDLILQLHGLSASAEPPTRREIERDVRRWWTQARIVTGWDSPAWTPDNTCPQCGTRGTLKIRLAERIGMCVKDECRSTWDEATIGLLADHIRIESATERRSQPHRGPCYCPWPRPTVDDLEFLCPACGSARCRHALMTRLLHSLKRGDVGEARGA